MIISNKVTIVSSISLLSIVALSLSAHANAPDNAAQLLPLESRSVIVEVDPELYKSAATQVNNFDPEQSESSDLVDALGVDFLDDFVDENGDVDLPLGITVFDAMGTTSVGFGGDF
jgi:hypothetical protein